MQVQRGLFPKISDPPKYPEKILFCGWRRDIEDMIMVINLPVISLVLDLSRLSCYAPIIKKKKHLRLGFCYG